jgi:hypothetical protein
LTRIFQYDENSPARCRDPRVSPELLGTRDLHIGWSGGGIADKF